MDIHSYIENFNKKDEQPLDVIKEDGGFCAIFRAIACVGDSLSSGEFEALSTEGVRTWHDIFEYSWGQFLARMTGAKVYNFSRGGMSTKEYCERFAAQGHFWNADKAAQAYIIALGVNDLIGLKMEIGSVDDIDLKDYHNNKPTFAGLYGKIIQRYKEIQPKARFFFVTMPRENDDEERKILKENHAKLLYDMTKIFSYSYVIDLNKYAPVYDEEFKKKFMGT